MRYMDRTATALLSPRTYIHGVVTAAPVADAPGGEK